MTDLYSDQFGHVSKQIANVLSNLDTCTLVKVVQVNSDRSVNVEHLVLPVGRDGKAVNPGVIAGVKYHALTGANGAVIVAPLPGDIGVLLTAHHDITQAKKGNSGVLPSFRRNNPADSLYFGGIFTNNTLPASVIELTTTKIVLTSPLVEINGSLSVTGASVQHQGKEIGKGHTHSGVQTGGGNTGIVN